MHYTYCGIENALLNISSVHMYLFYMNVHYFEFQIKVREFVRLCVIYTLC